MSKLAGPASDNRNRLTHGVMPKLVGGAVLVTAVAALLWLPLPWTISTRVAHSTQIERSPAEVYRYVTTPAHWPNWHPSSLAVRGAADHSLMPGEEVIEQFEVAGRSGEASWRVTARQPNRLWTILGTIRGRVAGQVTYVVDKVAVPPGATAATRFEREFVYFAPNLLFVVLDKLTINALVEDESKRAVENLKRVMETPPTAISKAAL